MRKLFTFFIVAFAMFTLKAQVPQGINYQAVARNASGSVLATQAVGVRISVVDGTPTGTVQYSEIYNVTTNQFGLFNVVIGNGVPSTGTFSAVTWASGNKFIKVEIDPNGGTAYVDMGTTKLQSVPYALYAPQPAIPPSDLNGTRNYIVRNNGSNSGINSAIWDSIGNVAIGHKKPSAVLDVAGNIYTRSKNSSDTSHSIFNRDSTRIGHFAGGEFVGMELKVEPYQCGNGGIIRFNTWGCNTSVTREVMRINELGNVGIGTSAPSAKLEVTGAILATSNQTTHNQGAYLEWNKDGSSGKTYLVNQKGLGGGGFSFCEVSTANTLTERMGIDGSGNVYIGGGLTANDGVAASISGGKQVLLGGGANTGSEVKFTYSGVSHFTVYNKGNNLLTFANASGSYYTNTAGFPIMTISTSGDLTIQGSAFKPGGGSWVATSDLRLKENVKNYNDGLAQLLKINPVTYHYNAASGYNTTPQYVGVIAQDIKQIAPYMVGTYVKDGVEYYNVDNTAMTYMLINAVKEQQTQIEKQNAENVYLQQQIDELKKMIEALSVQAKQ